MFNREMFISNRLKTACIEILYYKNEADNLLLEI